MLKKIVFSVILVSLFSLITLTANGYCDDWVCLGTNDNYSIYYNKTSLKINKEEKTIEAFLKRIYTEKGKNSLKKANIDKNIYDKINYVLILYLFNYDSSTFNINKISYYNKQYIIQS
jgi:hypothetical protein